MQVRKMSICAIAALGMLLGTALPASADTRRCTWDGASGCATVVQQNRLFYVCDYRRDNRSVVVQYQWPDGSDDNRTHWSTLGWAVHARGSRHRCITDRELAIGRTRIRFRVCLARYAGRGRPRMRVAWSKCGMWAYP